MTLSFNFQRKIIYIQKKFIVLVTFAPSVLKVKNTIVLFINIWEHFQKSPAPEPLSYPPSMLDNTFEAIPLEDIPDLASKTKSENRFNRIICPRNIFMLEQSSDPKETWTTLGILLFELIKNGQIVTKSGLEHQCTAFFQSDQPQIILEHFAICLKTIWKEYKSWKGEDQFTILLEFLFETCEQINREDGPLDFM